MKLLFDQNLSPRLVERFAGLFPDSTHVRELGLAAVDDIVVWEFARLNGFTIVSKDADFRQLSFVRGPPPKVVSIVTGNVSTNAIEAVLRRHAADLAAFEADVVAALIVLA